MKTTLHIDGKAVALENVVKRAQEVSFTLGKKTYHFRSCRLPDGSYVLEKEMAGGVWQRLKGSSWQGAKNARHVQLGALEARVTEAPKGGAQASAETELSPAAPMPSLVRQILVKVGDKVEKGTPLVMMEAMKLQTVLAAGGAGTVEAIRVKEGEMVAEGQELISLKPQ